MKPAHLVKKDRPGSPPRNSRFGQEGRRWVPLVGQTHRPARRVVPLDLDDLDKLIVKLQGVSMRKPTSVARVRDAAIVGLLAAGMPAARIFALRTDELAGLNLPRPVWTLLGMWAWRRSYVLGSDAQPMAFIASDARPLKALCLRQLVARRARIAGIQRLVLPSEIRLAAPWCHLPSELAPEWFGSALRGIRVVKLRVRVQPFGDQAMRLHEARERRGLPPFGTGLEWRTAAKALRRSVAGVNRERRHCATVAQRLPSDLASASKRSISGQS